MRLYRQMQTIFSHLTIRNLRVINGSEVGRFDWRRNDQKAEKIRIQSGKGKQGEPLSHDERRDVCHRSAPPQ